MGTDPDSPAIDPRIVRNARPRVDWNTCGPAAIATVLAHWRLGAFASGSLLGDGEAIDEVRRRFPPDVPLGLGTTAHRIAGALRAHGLQVERIHSGWFGRDAGHARDRLVAHVAAGHPVPVCLANAPVGAHWAIVLGFEPDRVRLGNWGTDEWLATGDFFERWRCAWLPYGLNHAAVLAWV